MTPCHRPDDFIDLLDGVAAPAVRAHAEGCAACRATLDEVRAALHDTQQADVPEPSPLFWSQVNARVAAAVAAEPTPARGWRGWLRLDVLVPLTGLAALVVALASAIDRAPAPDAAPLMATDAPDLAAPTGGDGALDLVLDLVATMSDGEFETLDVPALDLGVAAESLTAEERQALHALLTAAVERPQS